MFSSAGAHSVCNEIHVLQPTKIRNLHPPGVGWGYDTTNAYIYLNCAENEESTVTGGCLVWASLHAAHAAAPQHWGFLLTQLQFCIIQFIFVKLRESRKKKGGNGRIDLGSLKGHL